MSELALKAASQPAPVGKPSRLKVGKKLQVAIDAMVFDGADIQEAARIAKTSTRVLRKAFERGHVVKHLYKRREVLRASASAQNINRLVEIRDAADNLPAIQAIDRIESMGDERHANARAAAPFGGITVQIVTLAHAPSTPKEVQAIENTGDDR